MTGQVDRVAEDEEGCFQPIREFLSYMPQHAGELPLVVPCDDDAESRQQDIPGVMPEKSNQSYDMKYESTE